MDGLDFRLPVFFDVAEFSAGVGGGNAAKRVGNARGFVSDIGLFQAFGSLADVFFGHLEGEIIAAEFLGDAGGGAAAGEGIEDEFFGIGRAANDAFEDAFRHLQPCQPPRSLKVPFTRGTYQVSCVGAKLSGHPGDGGSRCRRGVGLWGWHVCRRRPVCRAEGTRISSVLKVKAAGSLTMWNRWAWERVNFCLQFTPKV